MEILIYATQTIAIILIAYLLASGIYFLVFALASHFYQQEENGSVTDKKRVAILIPAYKEDEVILETALAAKKHISFTAFCDVIVIADQLKNETIKKLQQMNAAVIPVTFVQSSKSKAIKFALSKLKGNYNYTVVLDADNIMTNNFIDRIVGELCKGYKVVQGQRIAKNSNTSFAVLDAVSEGVNNAIFRTGHRTLGLSASLIGSGFGADYNFFKSLIDKTTSVGGFDKELELMILKQGVTIGYAKNAIVLDEKIQEAGGFVNQRRRWLAAQWVYLFKGVKNVNGSLNIDYVDKKIQFIVPPRVMAIGVSFLLAVTFGLLTVFNLQFKTIAILCLAAWLLNSLAVLIVIPKTYFTTKTLYAIMSLPKGFLLTLMALFKIRNANKQFIHTSHGINKQA